MPQSPQPSVQKSQACHHPNIHRLNRHLDDLASCQGIDHVFSQCNLPPLRVSRILIKIARLRLAHIMQPSRLVWPRNLQPAGHSAPTGWISRISATHIVKATEIAASLAFVVWTLRIARLIQNAGEIAGCGPVTDATGPACCGGWDVIIVGDLGRAPGTRRRWDGIDIRGFSCAPGTRRRWDVMSIRDFGWAPRTIISVILTSPFELIFLSCA